jgi:hypothetical protein
LGRKIFILIFTACYENDYNQYKANQETVPAKGRCLIVLYFKIINAFPELGKAF